MKNTIMTRIMEQREWLPSIQLLEWLRIRFAHDTGRGVGQELDVLLGVPRNNKDIAELTLLFRYRYI
jgi:hypothetical protein